jgi:hypothetical protein
MVELLSMAVLLVFLLPNKVVMQWGAVALVNDSSSSYMCFFLLFCFLSLLSFLSFSLFFPLYSGFVAVLMTLINNFFFGIFEMFA